MPHTWQTLGNTRGYVGVAWYRLDFDAPAEWQNQFVRIEFEAAYHTAQVFLNGVPIGEHIGKGYTPSRVTHLRRSTMARRTRCCASGQQLFGLEVASPKVLRLGK